MESIKNCISKIKFIPAPLIYVGCQKLALHHGLTFAVQAVAAINLSAIITSTVESILNNE